MGTGFKSDVEGRALGAATGLSDGENFCVGLTRAMVIALSHDPAIGTTRAPTMGFGLVFPRPFAARRRASVM